MFGTLILLLTVPSKYIPAISDKKILRQVGPLILVNTVSMLTYTLSLQHMDIILSQIGKAMVLPMTLAISRMLKSSSSNDCLGPIALFVCGFLIGIVGEACSFNNGIFVWNWAKMPSAKGLALAFVSATAHALQTVLTRTSIDRYKPSTCIELPFLYNALRTLLLLPIVIAELLLPLIKLQPSDDQKKHNLSSLDMLWAVVVCGSLGLAYNILSFRQLKLTNPLTHALGQIGRTVLFSTITHVVLHERLSFTRILSTVIVMVASIWYTWTRFNAFANKRC